MQAGAAWSAVGDQAAGGVWYIVAIVLPLVFAGLLLFFVLRAILRQRRYRVVGSFDKEDERAVHQALAEAERRTVGEILPVVVERSDPHPGADWLAALGWSQIEAHIAHTSARLKARIRERPHLHLYTPLPFAQSSGLTAFSVEGWQAGEVSTRLRQEARIHVRVVPHCNALRISTPCFVDEGDIVLQALLLAHLAQHLGIRHEAVLELHLGLQIGRRAHGVENLLY